MALKTNYTDDVLDTSVNTTRKYTQILNSDGTVSFYDNTVYTKKGTSFGAEDVNSITQKVNENETNIDSTRAKAASTEQEVATIKQTVSSMSQTLNKALLVESFDASTGVLNTKSLS